MIEGGDEEMNTLDVEHSGEAFVSGGDDGLVKVMLPQRHDKTGEITTDCRLHSFAAVGCVVMKKGGRSVVQAY